MPIATLNQNKRSRLPYLGYAEIKNNPPKRPSFLNVCGKFYLDRLQNSRDISVQEDVAQAKICVTNLFINRCPPRKKIEIYLESASIWHKGIRY